MYYVLIFEDQWTYEMVGCYDTVEEANEVANNLDTELDIWVCSEEDLDQFNEDL